VPSLLANESGAEQVEYLLILAAVVIPLALAVQLLWTVLTFYFQIQSLVVDLPLF